MKDRLLICFCCTVMIACSNREELPAGVLPAEKMQGVMWDLMRADQFLADYVFSKDTSQNKSRESIKVYRQIFLAHGITKEEFRKSMTYYKAHPEQLKAIMDSVSNKALNLPADTSAPVAPVPVNPDTTAKPKGKIKIVPGN
jgi:Domain of unknown function (DUF4296)